MSHWKEELAERISEGELCAKCSWSVEDVLERYDVTAIEAARFLVDIEKWLAEAMVIRGWDVIEWEASRRGLTQKPEEEWGEEDAE